MAMYQFSSGQFEITWGAVPLFGGLSSGVFATIRPSRENFRYRPDGYGGVLRIPVRDKSGEVDLVIEPETPTAAGLIAAEIADAATYVGRAPLILTDFESAETITLTQAGIIRKPDRTYSSILTGPQTWTWKYTRQFTTPRFRGTRVGT